MVAISFEECLSKMNKSEFMKVSKNLVRIQKYFNNYNYTSPNIIVEENKVKTRRKPIIDKKAVKKM